MKKRVFAAVLICCMLLTVCSGCGKKTIRRNEGTLNESVTSMLDKAAENTASSPAAETVDRTAEFQAVMDAVSVDSRYASCKRYVMVNDYDGDGKQEASGSWRGIKPTGDSPTGCGSTISAPTALSSVSRAAGRMAATSFTATCREARAMPQIPRAAC